LIYCTYSGLEARRGSHQPAVPATYRSLLAPQLSPSYTDMASLTVELREAAGEGDIASLEVVLSICSAGLRHPNMVSTIIDIVTRNLQRDRFPQPPVKLSNASHRKWMKTLILSFSIFNVAFQSMFGRSQVVPEIPRRKLRAHWTSHIWPSLHAVIEIAVLDDPQATVDVGSTPENICIIVCETLGIINWETFDLTSNRSSRRC